MKISNELKKFLREWGKVLGKSHKGKKEKKSKKKQLSSRKNGRLGGRPRKKDYEK